MKKFHFYFAFIAALFMVVVGCEQSAIDVENVQALEEDVLASKKGGNKDHKVTICHYDEEMDDFHTITISKNAVESHMNHGDKYTYSPEGEYFILRENGAVLNITITGYAETTMVEGYGRNSIGETKYYYGSTFEYLDNNMFLMTVPQYSEPNGNGTGPGTHYIGGYISECGGIYNLFDAYEASSSNDPRKISEYSLTSKCDNDTLPFSPAGSYLIYRDNAEAAAPTNVGAVLNIMVNDDGTITGDGNTARNIDVTYSGTWEMTGPTTIKMTIPQFFAEAWTNPDSMKSFEIGDAGGTHYIIGQVSKCDGIIEDLSDDSNNYDYSFSMF